MKPKTKQILRTATLTIALFNCVWFFAPHFAHAAVNSLASGQICEPDNTPGGSAYNLTRCVNNIYAFSVAIGGFVAVLMFVVAGYYYTMGGNENVSKAKSFINSTIVGLILLFGTYALLNTIDPNLTKLPNLNAPGIKCETVTQLDPATNTNKTYNTCTDIGGINPVDNGSTGPVGGTTKTPPPGSVSSTKDCTNCVDGTSGYYKFTMKDGHYLNVALADALKKVSDTYTGFRITEAWPPVINHLSICHGNGQCVDIAGRGSYTADNKANFVNSLWQFCTALKNNGITIVNEYYDIPASYFQGSNCGLPTKFDTTTGGHLHIRLNN